MIFQSIRWRLQLWHGLILLAVLAGFGFTAFHLQRAEVLRRIDESLFQRADAVRGDLRNGRPPSRRPPEDDPSRGRSDFGDPPPPPEGFRVSSKHVTLFNDEDGYYFVLWRRSGQELGRSANAPAEVPPPAQPAQPAPSRTTRDRGMFREFFLFTPPGECILVGRSLAPERVTLGRYALWLTGLGAGVWILGLAGGWWVTTRTIRPIHDISATAERIAGGDLSHRIPTSDGDNELGRLAVVLNTTFARLEAAFRRQEQFTADASHELRTPVSVLLTQTQTTLARERSSSEYRAALEVCQRAAQRMRTLTESLLILARQDSEQKPSRREPCDLAKITSATLELIRPLAERRKIQLHTELGNASCFGDPEGLTQVVSNLLTNAIDYNHDGGDVRITTQRGGPVRSGTGTGTETGASTLVIWNTGPGVPAEDLPYIFDRFHRADKARTHATGHSGLGLAIAKAIVEAHGGTITAESDPEKGTTLVVTLPE